MKKTLLVGLLLLLLNGNAQAQVQINVQVLPPYSTQVADYIGRSDKIRQTFQEQMLITLRNTNPNEYQEIKLRIGLSGDNGISASINPGYQPVRRIILQPGELKVLTGQELALIHRNLLESDVDYVGISRNQIVRTGTLPEGNYQVCVQAFDFNTNLPISADAPQGCSPLIPVAYPDPPVLAYPFQDAEILYSNPQAINISWAPAPNASPDLRYRVRIIDLEEINANPYDIFETTNLYYFQEEDLLTTSLFYDQSKPQLVPGHQYAIRVQAYDPLGELQIKNNGWSEIHTFEYVEMLGDNTSLKDIDFISLEPGYLELTALDKLTVINNGAYQTFNGEASLLIRNPLNGTEVIVPVTVENLTLASGNFQNPEILKGNVKGISMDATAFDFEPYFYPERITWKAGEGVTLEGIIKADGQNYVAAGNGKFTGSGFMGQVTSSATAGSLASLGECPVELKVNQVSVIFPRNELKMVARMRVFDQDICDLEQSFDTNATDQQIYCNLQRQLPMVAKSSGLTLNLQQLMGSITLDWPSQKLDYNLDVNASITMDQGQGIATSCALPLSINLQKDQPVSFESYPVSCNFNQSKLDMGAVELALRQLSLEELNYSNTNEWGFLLKARGSLYFPAFDQWHSPIISEIIISPDGIQLPEFSFDVNDFQNHQVRWDSYGIGLNRLYQQPMLFPWFSWGKIGPGPWDYVFEGFVQFPDKSEFPACLRNARINFTGASLQDELHYIRIEGEDIGACEWPVGENHAVKIDSVSGKIAALYKQNGNQKFKHQNDVQLYISMRLGEPFNCAQGETIAMKTALKIDKNPEGLIKNVVPGCSFNIGPFTANVDQSDVHFNNLTGTNQEVYMKGKATLQLDENLDATGTFTLDLVSGKFTQLEFRLQGPFEMPWPNKQNPVAVFRINEAVINNNGILVDGKQELLIDEQPFAVDFQQALFDPQSKRLKSGTIQFEQTLALQLNADNNQALDFELVKPGGGASQPNSIYMEFAAGITLDSAGIKPGLQNGRARVNLEQLQAQEDVEIVFSQDFIMNQHPLSVLQGEAVFFYQGNRIGYLDPTGFHLDAVIMTDQLMTDRIPLPHNDIAYLLIKEGDQWLAQADRQADGRYLINGQNMKLVMPALNNGFGSDPFVWVDVNNLLVNTGNGSVEQGEIVADVPAGFNDQVMPGLPLMVNRVGFSKQQNNAALFLQGNLKLFEQTTDIEAIFYVESDGILKSSLMTGDQNAMVDLLPAHPGLLSLRLNSINGNLEYPLFNAGQGNFSWEIAADLLIKDGNGQLISQKPFAIDYEDHEFTARAQPQPNTLADSVFVDAGELSFFFYDFKQINLNYSKALGFSLNGQLSGGAGLKLEDGKIYAIGLQAMEFDSEIGLFIPAQTISEQTIPKITNISYEMGIYKLKLLALRAQEARISWQEWQSFDFSAFNPKADLEISFPGLHDTAPQLASSKVYVNNAGYENGRFTGNIEPVIIYDDLIYPLIDDLPLHIREISGNLSVEGISLNLRAALDQLPYFNLPQNECPEATINLSLNSQGLVEGSLQNFAACGKFQVGNLAVRFPTSSITFSYQNGIQQAQLTGQALATLQQQDGNPVQASGDLAIDLVTGKIISGRILINGPITWYFPPEEKYFAFTVQTIELDQRGLVFNGRGSLEAGDGGSMIQYHDMTIELPSGELSDGYATIENSIAFDYDIEQNQWSINDPIKLPNFDTGFRITIPDNQTIDKNGLEIMGESNGIIKYNNQSFNALATDFQSLNLLFSPFRATSGKADFILGADTPQENKIAYYDSTGFNLYPGSVIQALIPDTLDLPRRDIAYIVLRENGQLLVESTEHPEGNGQYLRTNRPLPLVVPALQGTATEPPRYDISFVNVLIGADLLIKEGEISLNAIQDPIDLSAGGNVPVLSKAPIFLTSISYKKYQNQPYQLYGAGYIKLPEALNDIKINVDSLLLGPEGLAYGIFQAGNFRTDYEAGLPPLAERAYADGALTVAFRGAELVIDQNNKTFKLSGDVSSKMLRNEQEVPSYFHFIAEYHDDRNWQFQVNTEVMTVPLQKAELTLHDLEIMLENDEFYAYIGSATLNLEQIVCDGFELNLKEIKLSTQGVTIADASQSANQFTKIFGLEEDAFQISSLRLEYNASNGVLNADMDGNFNLFGTPLDIQGLNVATNGTISLEAGSLALLGNGNTIDLFGETLSINLLNLLVNNNKLGLGVGGTVDLPQPIGVSSNFSGLVDQNGIWEMDGSLSVSENLPSVDIGTLGTFNMTQIGLELDFTDWTNSVFFASADLYLDTDEGEKIIKFGTPNGNFRDAGFSYQYGDKLRLYVHDLQDVIRLDLDIFTASLHAITFETADFNDFALGFSASYGLNIADVGGQILIENFTIGKDGITDYGDVTGGGFSFRDVIKVQVGQFELIENESVPYVSPNNLKNGDNEIGSLSVEKGFRFFSEQVNGRALDISLGNISGETEDGGMLSGGMERLYLYKNGGKVYAGLDDMKLGIGGDYLPDGVGKVNIFANANLEYLENNDYFFRIAGNANLEIPGQPVSVGVVGKAGKFEDKSTFGIYAVAKANVPLYPGIVDITGVGMGFFYNPSEADLDLAVKVTDYQLKSRKYIDNIESNKFMPLFYGSCGLIGTSDLYVAHGGGMIIGGDAGATFDFTIDFLLPLPFIKGGAFVTASYPRNNDGKIDNVRLSSGGWLGFKDYMAPLITGDLNMALNSYFNLQDRSIEYWSLTANTTDGKEGDALKLFGKVDMKGKLAIAPGGLFSQTNLSISPDIPILNVNSDLNLEMWVDPEIAWTAESINNNRQDLDEFEFGGYGEMNVTASFLLGALKLSGTSKGALFNDNDNNYQVYSVFSKSHTNWRGKTREYSMWTSYTRDDWGWGLGKGEYADRIAAAAEKAEEMETRVQEFLEELNALMEQLDRLSQETLANAGANFLMDDASTRNNALNTWYQAEQAYSSPPAFINSLHNLVANSERPAKPDLGYLQREMLSKINEARTMAEEARAGLQNLQLNTIEIREDAQASLQSFLNPVSNMQLTWEGDEDIPEFTLDEGLATQNKGNAENIINYGFQEEDIQLVIEQLKDNIDQLDEKLSGKRYLVKVKDFNSLTPADLAEPITEASAIEVSLNAGNNTSEGNAQAGQEVKQSDSVIPSGGVISSKPISMDTEVRFNYSNSTSQGNAQVNPVDINQLNETYQEAYRRTTEYFGKNISSLWQTHFWAKDHHNTIEGWKDLPITYANSFARAENIYTNLYNQNTWASEDEVALVNARRNLIRQYSDKEVATIENRLTYLPTFNNSLYEITNFFSQGYDKVADDNHQTLLQVQEASEGYLDSLRKAHTGITNVLDGVYNAKYNVMSSLHGLLQMYKGWANENGGQSKADSIQLVIEDYEKLMTPPAFNFFISRAELGTNRFDRRLSSAFVANHYSGVTDYSYRLSESGSIYSMGGMRSLGDKAAFSELIYLKDSSQLNQQQQFIVRARGAAGNSASRMGSIDMQFGDGAQLNVFENTLVNDETPPYDPNVFFEYHHAPVVAANGIAENTYWTNQAVGWQFRVVVYDMESDIAELQYAIGSSPGTTDLKDWTVVFGQPIPAFENNSSGLPNSNQQITINDFPLQVGVKYYISVKAKNGVGLWSAIGSPEYPLQLDVEGPMPVTHTINSSRRPGSTYIPGTARSVFWGAPPVQEPVATTPTMVPPVARGSLIEPYFEIGLQADDDQSGVRSYLHYLSNDANWNPTDTTDFNQTTESSVILEETPLSFTDTAYLYLAAVDNAGNVGEVNKISLQALDPTRPRDFKAQLRVFNNKARIHLTQPAIDFESGEIYEYAIGTSPTQLNIQGWQEVENYEFNFSLATLGIWKYAVLHEEDFNTTNVTAPYFNISLQSLTPGDTYYVKVRAKNGQGAYANTTTFGPVIYDITPPLQPVISTSFQNGVLSASVSQINDPETDIYKVEYRVQVNSSWGSWKTVSGAFYNQSQNTAWVAQEITESNLSRLRIEVRITNNNGLVTTKSKIHNLFQSGNTNLNATQPQNTIGINLLNP